MAMVSSMDLRVELQFPCWKPLTRRFPPTSPFFAPGNIGRELLAKQVALDLSEDEQHILQMVVEEHGREVLCPIVGCGAWLQSLEDFEDHYESRHTASCSMCFRVYPSTRLLGIHISEAHDSFFQAKVAHGYSMFECLVEGCGMKFKSQRSRHQHLVDKHKFPASFRFFNKAHPSKKARIKQHRKLFSQKREPSGADVAVEDEALDSLVSSISNLSTTASSPSSFNFGHCHCRGLMYAPHLRWA